tara:strand:- start:370 stop:555 length:186 start_codon:yes stop_codon:yes gene_type:complete
MKELPSKTGFQPSTIYELISKGKFPAPFKLIPGGRAAGWFETTIDDWMAKQAERSQVRNPK